MNAGFQPLDHWTHKDGGRIIGEACHIIDLFNFLVDDTPKSVSIDSLNATKKGVSTSDNKIITVTYEDGSICSLVYTGQGSSDLNKERMEVFFDQKSIILDDYKVLTGYGIKLNSSVGTNDKGHKGIIKAFADSIKEGGAWPISLESLVNTTKITIMANAE
jgi:predicted dehydrogenase